MPAAATSNQLLLNLNASGAPSGSKGRTDKRGDNDFAATFQQQVQQQISARQSERLNSERLSQTEIQRPRNEAPQRERDTQVNRPDRQDNTTRPANETRPQNTEQAANENEIDQNAGCEKPQQTGEAAESTAEGGKTARTGKPGQTEGDERPSSAEEALAQQLNQANAALLLQLQNFVSVRPDVAAAAANNAATDQGDAAAASPVAQLANVLNALQQIHDQSQDAALDANAGKGLVKGDTPQFKTLTEALQFAADRQALPADAEAEPKVTLEFSELLQRRLPQTEQPIGPRNDMGLQGVHGRPAEGPRAADASRPQASLYQPVGSEGWDRALGQKVVMMVDNSQQEVDMQLNPPNLGPLEVKLTLDKNEATLTFVAAHQPVKEALQASLPRLTEMLAESGIQLGNVNIELGGRQAEQGREQAQRQGGRSGNGLGGEDDEGVTAVNSQAARRLAMTAPGNVNLFV